MVLRLIAFCILGLASGLFGQAALPVEDVEGQPLGANVRRLMAALRYLGTPISDEVSRNLDKAISDQAADRIQTLLDPHVVAAVSLNPEVRVKVVRGPGKAELQQFGFTPVIIKVSNQSTVTRRLNIFSPQEGAVYAGASELTLERQAQTELSENENSDGRRDRFLTVEMFRQPPLTPNLSGLEVEYVLALFSSSESGKREATLAFDVGGGTQDIGFRGEVPVLFAIRPALKVPLEIVDENQRPTTARLTFRDREGRVMPPQPKRLAPDFFFQPHIYRHHGETVLLPPGEFDLTYSRGPEYIEKKRKITVSDSPAQPGPIHIALERWIDPGNYGYFSGDHHIHGAGCSHYTSPTQGVRPQDMFRQVKGEGLNVGCVLTWGPCFDFQRRYFSPLADDVSEPLTVLKYDLEISGFGSAALGHVCLLNLKDQTYPGSEGSKDKGWPTWTVPVMRWTKEQGGFTGYPHSALHVNPESASERMMERLDANEDGAIDLEEAKEALMPSPFDVLDRDNNGTLDDDELVRGIEIASHKLPNLVVPEMNGAGAMEIFVSVAEGVCDFVSAMDTARVPEWNTWYHLMNCGFPLKLSGETDFPCMSSRRVGQGRVYVQLGKGVTLDYAAWCAGLAEGRSYVSDGYAHALEFAVAGQVPGPQGVRLDRAGEVEVRARVAFAAQVPRAVAYGQVEPGAGRRMVGDTVHLHADRTDELVDGGERLVELVVNGRVMKETRVPADGNTHSLRFDVPINHSSWVALRQFPQLHTNPVVVAVDGEPIRASRDSARWCREATELLWKNRHGNIAEAERSEARKAYDRAIAVYQKIESEGVE